MTEHETTPAQPEAEPSPADEGDADMEPDALDELETPGGLEALREELEQARGQHARAVADYQNLERRSREGRAEAVRMALGGLVSGFLPVLDDLDRALDAAPESPEAVQWVEGVRLVAQKFAQTLQQHGVQEVPALGEDFDPTKHEAVGAAPGPEGQVVTLLRRGYTLHGYVVRPAMVMVGNGDGAEPATAQADSADG